MSRQVKPRYAVKVTDWSNQETLIGTFALHERAAALAASINAEIEKRNRGNVQGYASVVLIEPLQTAASVAEWATGYGTWVCSGSPEPWDADECRCASGMHTCGKPNEETL